MQNKDFGYFDNGLGRYVYHTDQMGNVFADIWGSITGGVKKSIDKSKQDVLDDIRRLPDAARAKAMEEFLKTGTGEETVAEAKKTWMQQQVDNAKVYYVQNKSQINMALAGVAALAVAYIILRKPARRQALKETVVQYLPIPQAPVTAPATPAAPAVAANARKRRKYRRK